MSLSVPNNPPIVNEAVAKPITSGVVIDENMTKINQLHGIASNNAIGAGIPKQVSNVQVSIANASQGATCTVSVLFKADPTDAALSGVKVWVKGYQGNSNPVLVGSGTSSPTKIVLNNTGETVSFVIQAFGNGGSAPFNQAPTCSGTLPKSTAGGFGSSTSTSGNPVSGSATPGQLAKFATPATTLTGADLTGDVETAGSVATTVKKIQGTPVTSSVPKEGDALRYSIADLKYMRCLEWDFIFYSQGIGTTISNILPFIFQGNAGATTAYTASGTVSGVAATATELAQSKFACAASNPASASLMPTAAAAIGCLGLYRRIRFRLALGQTTNTRIWIGLETNASTDQNNWRSDAPNRNFVGFRYSTAASDTKYQCVTQTSNVAQTITAESTSSHVDTSVHTFDIILDGAGNVTFYIDETLVGSSSTNVPALTTAMLPAIILDNAGSANASFFTWSYTKGSLALL